MNKPVLYLTRVAVLVGSGVLLWRLVSDSDWTRVSGRDLDLAALTATLATMLGTFLAAGWTSWATYRRSPGGKVTIGECVGLGFFANAANYLGPAKLGALVRAAYLIRREGLTLDRFLGRTTLAALIHAAATATLGALSALVVWWRSGESQAVERLASWLLPGFGSIAVAAGFVLWISTRYPPQKLSASGHPWLRRFGKRVETALRERPRRRLIAAGVLVQHAFSTASYVAVGAAVGVHLSAPQALVLVTAVTLSYLLALTPGNLGLQELIVAGLLRTLGASAEAALLVAAIVRLAHLALSVLGAALFSWLAAERLAAARSSALARVTPLAEDGEEGVGVGSQLRP